MKLQHDFASFIFLLLSILCVTDGCHDGRAALLNFKSSLADHSNRWSSWQGQNCCSRFGIRCSDLLHAIAVNLRNPNPDSFILNINSQLVSTSDSKTSTAVQGTISPSLFSLHHLRYLDLSFKDFMFSKLPTGFSNLTRLTYLSLENAMFSDSITTQFANLTSLRWLDLSCSLKIVDDYIYFGHISSSNLDWLWGLRNLRELRLSGVDPSKASQSSKWAEPLSILSDLRLLHLSNCGVFGMVPKDLIFSLLKLLDLSQLHSPTPLHWFNSLLVTVEFRGLFFLPWQTFQSIPDFLSNLTQLAFLSLANNSLSGTIPSWLFNLPKLNYLDLAWDIKFSQSSRAYSSGIPLPFCGEDNVLFLLDLSNNMLVGRIPISVGNCTSLVVLNPGGNNLGGNIPNVLKAAKDLTYLELSDNHFDGPFPSFIQKLKKLEVLMLANNRLEGKIPRFIGDLKNLHILVLRSNSFNDSIPAEINKLEKLQFLDFSNNKLFGPLPEKLDGLKLLREREDGDILDFSCNKLTGNIPLEIGLLEVLFMLNISHNSLSGMIPDSIGSMKGLESLDLSFNNLRGEIPTALSILDALTTLNLSYSNLSGKIPAGRHFETLNEDGSAYIGNKFLCGAPDGATCDSNASSPPVTVDVEDDI
ncbi:unnamed protein product, partial [Vitis vinifera]